MTDKKLTEYIEQHAFISDEVKDIMLMLIKERNYCLTLPNQITQVKDLIGYLRCVPQENVLMIETDAEDVLEKTEIVLDIDDVLLGHGTTHGICYLKLTGLKELTDKVKEETINEFAEKLNNEISKFVLEHKDNLDFASGISVAWNMVDETAEEMKKKLANNYIVSENGLSSASRNYMKEMAMDKIVEQSEPLIIQDRDKEYTNLAKELGADCIFIE